MNKLLILALISCLFVSYAASQNVECTICQFVVGWVEGEMSANATEEEVEQLLDSVCAIIFSWDPSLVTTCDNVIATYYPDLVQYILAEESPDVACTAVGACGSSLANVKPVIHLTFDNSSCQTCLTIVTVAENFISSDATEEEVEKILENICILFWDSTMQAECDSIIESFTPEIIAMLIANEDPEVVCAQVEYCQFGGPGGAIECSLCQAAVGYAEAYVTSNTTEQELENLLDKACVIFPNSTQQLCDGIVNTLVTDGFQLIINDEAPSVVCTQVGLCSSAFQNYHQIGMLLSKPKKVVKKNGKKNGKKNNKKNLNRNMKQQVGRFRK